MAAIDRRPASSLGELTTRVRSGAFVAVFGFLTLGAALPASLSADESVAAPKVPLEAPDYQNRSLYGSYLAGRYARSQREMDAAARFYRDALMRDPDNKDILQQAFLSEAAVANWPEAAIRAEKVVEDDPANRLARIFLGIQAFKNGNFAVSEEHLLKAAVGPIGELTATLARAWVRFGDGKPDEAVALVDGLRQDWARFYRDNHKALILDAAGRTEDAAAVWAALFKEEPRTVRVALGYAHHAAASGNTELARKVLRRHMRSTGGRDALASQLLRDITDGKAVALLATNAEQGAAELFYGLGEALTTEGGIDVGTIYLQLALYLRDGLDVAHYALGNVHEATKHYQQAIDAYNRIDEPSPVAFEAALRKAYNLNWLEELDQARVELDALLVKVGAERASLASRAGAAPGVGAQVPLSERIRFAQQSLSDLGYYEEPVDGVLGTKTKDAVNAFQKDSGLEQDGLIGPRTILSLNAALTHDLESELSEREQRVLLATGNLLRGHQKYKEAIEYYSRAIAMINKPLPDHWNYFYSRGVCYEREKNWEAAEADLEQALSLNPTQPLILNYLGYSWVDQKLNLDRAMDLIRKAVRLKPDDGYFVDSLGWAYFRLGKYEPAARYLERAVELRPEDPVINDHLGDAYWRVGRRLEARYQWSQSLDLKPEPEDVERIQGKLIKGLAGEDAARIVRNDGSETGGAAASGASEEPAPSVAQ